jgi:hypothetical protein
VNSNNQAAVAERNAQGLDNVVIVDASERVTAALAIGAAAAAPSDGAPRARDDVLRRNAALENITTALLTSAGYPVDNKDAFMKANRAPDLAPKEAAAWSELMARKVGMEPPAEQNLGVDRLLELANSAGLADDVAEEASRRATKGAADASALDAAQDGDQLGRLAAELADGIEVAPADAQQGRPVISQHTILTSEAGVNLAGFQDTMKSLGWLDRLDDYYATGRVKVNPYGVDDVKEFGLTAGQVVGKLRPTKGPPTGPGLWPPFTGRG